MVDTRRKLISNIFKCFLKVNKDYELNFIIGKFSHFLRKAQQGIDRGTEWTKTALLVHLRLSNIIVFDAQLMIITTTSYAIK